MDTPGAASIPAATSSSGPLWGWIGLLTGLIRGHGPPAALDPSRHQRLRGRPLTLLSPCPPPGRIMAPGASSHCGREGTECRLRRASRWRCLCSTIGSGPSDYEGLGSQVDALRRQQGLHLTLLHIGVLADFARDIAEWTRGITTAEEAAGTAVCLAGGAAGAGRLLRNVRAAGPAGRRARQRAGSGGAPACAGLPGLPREGAA